jgi:hypothetical protein
VSRFEAEPYLQSLKGFQRATVEHVTDRLYRSSQPSRRFLVADETGLGKSLVARGVIARAIEALQDDDDVKRIDVVYVCSNADIAEQNLRRLNVTGHDGLPVTGRLTMLAKHSRQLAAATAAHGKPVNLVSFTPGTSFQMGWRTGTAEERALLHLLIVQTLGLRGRAEKSSRMLLQGGVQLLSTFTNSVNWLRCEMDGEIDAQIANRFAESAADGGHLRRFEELIEELGRKQSVPTSLKAKAFALTGKLRGILARASVETLEPDLVILDEFQRFRDLLDPERGGDAANLAHLLFNYPQARVLLLSATPYKPFTLADEGPGEDHHTDFLRTLTFLAKDSPVNLEQVATDLSDQRASLVTGQDASPSAQRLRDELLLVMARTERPQLGRDGMLLERAMDAAPVKIGDLTGFAALRQLADAVKSDATIEYWKSVPYFATFMDGYQLATRVRDRLDTPSGPDQLRPLLVRTQHVKREAIECFDPVDPGNGRLRTLSADTVDKGWWRLLWVPPSMPYLEPAGPYAAPGVQGMTKRLIFSSWSAAPTAIACLLSYEAERNLMLGSRLESNTAAARAAIATRLDYNLRGDQAASMSTLILFWPHPELAGLADPLRLARSTPDGILSQTQAERHMAELLNRRLDPSNIGPAGDGMEWRAVLSWPGAIPTDLPASRIIEILGTAATDEADSEPVANTPRGVQAHVRLAFEAARGLPHPASNDKNALSAALSSLALHAPGNIAYRALSRVFGDDHTVTEVGHWVAAATLAGGMRSLFNRLETTVLLDQLYGSEETYWRLVLRYCAEGNLQAAMDEYLHHLVSGMGITTMNDENLLSVATAAMDALSMRPSRYEGFNPERPAEPLSFRSRFALRYGGKRLDQESARQPQVRNAFNSPFWPFVLATTSVGQEGIDFHWWCHAVVHWNLPANAVDFEQREGRVSRFGGHAVRRNVATRHRDGVMLSDLVDPWKTAYDLAQEESGDLGDFAPYWIYPGPFKVERHLLNYPLSRDAAKLVAIKDDLALYRLALGQPRQEDLLDFLKRRGVTGRDAKGLNLRPPALDDRAAPTSLTEEFTAGSTQNYAPDVAGAAAIFPSLSHQ